MSFTRRLNKLNNKLITSDKGGGKCFCPCSFVCLSVCLLARLLITKKTRAWIWMKCCVSTDVGPWTNWLTLEPAIRIIVRMPEPDCFLRYRISAATRNVTSGKSHVHVLAAWFLERAVVLKWFYSLSCRITFVGGACALPIVRLISLASSCSK